MVLAISTLQSRTQSGCKRAYLACSDAQLCSISKASSTYLPESANIALDEARNAQILFRYVRTVTCYVEHQSSTHHSEAAASISDS